MPSALPACPCPVPGLTGHQQGSAWRLGCSTEVDRQVALVGQQRGLSWAQFPLRAQVPPPGTQGGPGSTVHTSRQVLATHAGATWDPASVVRGQTRVMRHVWGGALISGPWAFLPPPVSLATEGVSLSGPGAWTQPAAVFRTSWCPPKAHPVCSCNQPALHPRRAPPAPFCLVFSLPRLSNRGQDCSRVPISLENTQVKTLPHVLTPLSAPPSPTPFSGSCRGPSDSDARSPWRQSGCLPPPDP